jgi:hypothetical protein
MIEAITKEWMFDTAQTDFKLEDVATGFEMIVSYCQVTVANGVTNDVAIRIGMATATLPAETVNSATGNLNMVLSHPGIAPGGGAVVTNGGAPIAKGEDGADLRMTCSEPTGGQVRVIVSFRFRSIT